MRCTRLNLWCCGRRRGQFRLERSPAVCGIWPVTHREVVPPAQRGPGTVRRPPGGLGGASGTLPGMLRPSQPARCDAPSRGSTGRTGSSAAPCSSPLPGTAPSRTRTGVSPPGTDAPPGPAPAPSPVTVHGVMPGWGAGSVSLHVMVSDPIRGRHLAGTGC